MAKWIEQAFCGGYWLDDATVTETGDDKSAEWQRAVEEQQDNVNHPSHYTCHPSGIEPIEITEHMGFCLGNVIKYVMRAPYKGREIEDLKKAQFYLDREIERLERCR